MNSLKFGTACLAAFVLLTAMRDVFLNRFLQTGSVLFIACAAATLAILFGTAWDLVAGKGRGLRALVRTSDAWLRVNLCTSLAWLAYFGSLKWLEPALALTLYMGMRPAVALVTGDRKHVRPAEVGLQMGAVAAMVWLVGAAVLGRAGFQPQDPLAALGAAALAAAGGMLMAGTVAFSRRLNDAGATPMAAMAGRMALLVPLTVTLALATGDVERWPGTLAAEHAAAAFLMVTPLIVYHGAIARLTPLAVNVGTALGPILVLGIQTLEGRIVLTPASAVGVSAYAGFALLAAWARTR